MKSAAGRFHRGTTECSIIENPVHTFSINLKCRRSSQYDHDDRFCGRRAAGMMTVTSVDSLGATMRTRLLNIRSFKIVSGLAFCLAMLPASSHAFTQQEQQRLCTGDVFRLCSSEIPDRARIIACMHRQKASLSQGCRSVFGKPADRSASARQSDDY